MQSHKSVSATHIEFKRREFLYLPIDTLFDPHPDPAFSPVDGLLGGIARHGLIQPLIVVPSGEQYRVVSGQKQFACCLLLRSENRLPEGDCLPCIIESQDEIEELLLAENLQRQEIDVLEEAGLMDAVRKRLGASRTASEKILAERLCLSEGYVRSTLKLLVLPDEIQSQWKKEGKFYLKRTQILEIARKKPEDQKSAWNSALQRAKAERPEKQQRKTEGATVQVTMEEPAKDMNTKSAITFKRRPENLTFANSPEPRKAAVAPQPSPPLEPAEQSGSEANPQGAEIAVTVHDFQEMSPMSSRPVGTPLIQPPEPPDRSRESDEDSLLQIDLEEELPTFAFAVTSMLHDLSKFNPARYKPRDKAALAEAMETFMTELTETATVVADIRKKLMMGPEVVATQLVKLKQKAGIQKNAAKDVPVDLSRNSFNEVIEQIIKSLDDEELQCLERSFQNGLKLNPTLKKRSPERYKQILHGLLIDHFMDQVASQDPDNKGRCKQAEIAP